VDLIASAALKSHTPIGRVIRGNAAIGPANQRDHLAFCARPTVTGEVVPIGSSAE
jgi:hypothetical protein